MSTSDPSSLPPLPLPEGITENYVDCPAAGLTFHILEAGYSPSTPKKPLILLLHGFPELAYSWRKLMPLLSQRGYYVVAPDQRGYGRTTGWDTRPYHQCDLSQFTMTSLVRDLVVLVHALGHHAVHCVIGHDFGALSAAMCALMRPDLFTACVLMSHPFAGLPALPFATAHPAAPQPPTPTPRQQPDIHEALAKLDPPRKHYKWYNSTPPAAEHWSHPAQGLRDYLRGYVHVKSADWAANAPRPLEGWRADELARMPEYYIMPLHATFPETIAKLMEGEDEDKTKAWLPDDELAVYVAEWERTGFQGALNWYRSQTDPARMRDVHLFAGKKIDVPVCFVSGEKDWGNYQQPGVLERMGEVCRDFRGTRLVQGAGHWPQQEKPQRVGEEVLGFLGEVEGTG